MFRKDQVIFDGSALHRDGRLFIVCINGELLTIAPDNGQVTFMYPEYDGKPLCMNHLVFDKAGNFYVTNFTGTIADPTGGVFRLSSNAETVEPVLQNLASPNGISLSLEGNTLGVGESTRNTVLSIHMLEDGITPEPIVGVFVPSIQPDAPDRIHIRLMQRAICTSVLWGKAEWLF